MVSSDVSREVGRVVSSDVSREVGRVVSRMVRINWREELVSGEVGRVVSEMVSSEVSIVVSSRMRCVMSYHVEICARLRHDEYNVVSKLWSGLVVSDELIGTNNQQAIIYTQHNAFTNYVNSSADGNY